MRVQVLPAWVLSMLLLSAVTQSNLGCACKVKGGWKAANVSSLYCYSYPTGNQSGSSVNKALGTDDPNCFGARNGSQCLMNAKQTLPMC